MPRSPLKASAALARVLRERRLELGLTTREVEARTARDGERVPRPTLRKIEEAKQEPGVRRLYALCRVYGLPLEVVPDLLELDQSATQPPEETNAQRLFDRGYEHWKRGEIGPALAHLMKLRLAAPEGPAGVQTRHKALLSFSIAAAALGRAKLAHRIAEELLIEGPDPSLLLNVLFQMSVTWLKLGSPSAALGFLLAAENVMTTSPNERHRGMLLHQRGRVLHALSRLDEAEQALHEAEACYRASGEDLNALLAQCAIAQIHLTARRFKEALAAASAARADAESGGFAMQACLARIDEGRALFGLRQHAEALGMLRLALSESISLGHHGAEFYAHYWMWMTADALGDAELAQVELDAALYHSRFVDELSPEVRQIRALRQGTHHATARRHKRTHPDRG